MKKKESYNVSVLIIFSLALILILTKFYELNRIDFDIDTTSSLLRPLATSIKHDRVAFYTNEKADYIAYLVAKNVLVPNIDVQEKSMDTILLLETKQNPSRYPISGYRLLQKNETADRVAYILIKTK